MSIAERINFQISPPPADRADAPKLVFLHGVMGFGINFRRIARPFENEFQTLLYDQRGHGRSFHAAPGSYKPEDYANDLAELLEHLGWKEISLLGHSLGGRVAMRFASRFPEKVTRLVIEDIGPSMHASRTSLVIRLLDAVPTPFVSKRAAQEWFATEFMQIFATEPQKLGLSSYLYANLTENAAGQAVWRFDENGVRETVANGRVFERWEDVKALTMPTLVVRGEKSSDLPRETFEEMLRREPHFQGVEIKGASHWIHSDQPDLFISVIERFLHDQRQVASAGVEVVR